jgi:hypothetical protein
MGIVSNPNGAIKEAAAQPGATISVNTQSGYKKSNQSKVFYHDSQWWAIAFNVANSRWCFWRYDGDKWTKTRNIEMGTNFQWDAVVDPGTGKVYLFGSHPTNSHFWRFSYIGGTWSNDPAYPRPLPNFTNADQGNAISLVQAKNGELWLFRIDNGKLQAKRSNDEGLTWSATINVKTGLTSPKGATDAVALAFNGNNGVGVAYGETGVANAKYGFLFHRDGNPDGTWTDESAALAFFGSEEALNQISMTSDAGNNIYLLTRNTAASGNLPRNTLYKRVPQNGIWEKHKVNSDATRIWKSPAIAIDGANGRLYCMGVNTTTAAAEYKTCILGQEATLDTATAHTLFASPGASFDDLSAPPGGTNGDVMSGVMVCVDNTTANDIWYRLLPTGTSEPVTLGTITVGSNEANANTQYTIPLTLSSTGALNAGNGALHFRFAPNTYVPDAMPAGSVLVNGTPATSIISGSKERHVTVIPQSGMNLSNSQAVSVVFLPSAGLLNPTKPATYRTTAWTSAQPQQVLSAPIAIAPTTTTVTPAIVTPIPGKPDSCANYTISFNLGPQGRFPATGSFTLTFDAATKITGGNLNGVKVNGVPAAATGNNTTKVVKIALPGLVKLTNNSAVTLYLPSTAVCNPTLAGDYFLTIHTSVETTPVASNAYRINVPLAIGPVLVAPAQTGVPASYTISLGLASNHGSLAGGVDNIFFRFPTGTVVPDSIPENQITVDGAAATTVVSNSATREVNMIVPTGTNLANSDTFSVVFKTGAGLFNPASAGSYALEAWTNAQPAPATSPLYTLSADSGSAISTLTKSGYKKANQSKVFYHDGQWWAVAFNITNNRWHIWKYNGATWSIAASLDKGITYHWDAVLNAATGKLYLFGSHVTAPEFRRYSYVGGTWTRDAGYPIVLADFVNADQNNPVSLVRAKNGELWIFRIWANKLQAKRSSDEGLTWSAPITVKSGLAAYRGTTDALAFVYNGNNHVGVAYGEADTVGSKYGFLRHRDGDPDGTWTDESPSLTFFGSERALNAICAAVDNDNNVYLITRNNAATGSLPRNTLYKRLNTSAWKRFKVNASAAHAWKTPAIVIDANPSGGLLYIMGVDITSQLAEYKICLIGNEASLETATVSGLFSGAGAAFDDLSVPAPHSGVNAVTGLMVTVDNIAASDTWYRHLPISPASGIPVSVGTVALSSNEVNANAQYTIPLALSDNGALAAGSGVINLIFPNNTHVPSGMAAGDILVDGTPASSIIVNSTTRQVSITTPITLPNNHAFSVVFNQAAGLLNPTLVDTNYKLIVWTSIQTAQVESPTYALTQATSTVTAATIQLFPTDADSLADYTLNFNLGNHGRLISGTAEGGASAFVLKFGAATRVKNGAFGGAKLNNTGTTAIGDSILRQITVTAPTPVSFMNNAAVTLFLPKSAIRNPAIAGNYTLTVATSVETTAVASNPYTIAPNNAIGAPIPGTTKNFDRNNQSKTFYHDGFWWVAAQAKADQKWYLWKFDGVSWSQHLLIHSAPKNRPDCVLHASGNKAYILLPGSSTTYIMRLSYSGGNWSVDSGPYAIPEFEQGSDRGINLVRAANGNLWVFMLADSTLRAKYSSNAGQSWSSPITLKHSLHNGTGLTDAVAFVYNGQNHLGVGYAENSAAGAVYGFLRHKDSDADTVWTDETASIPQFSGTNADDHISMAVYSGKIHMLVKTNGGGPSIVNIGLLVRETNAIWSQYPVLLSGGWTRPTLAVDQTHNVLYVFGTRESGAKVGEMKKCAIGNYAALQAAPIDTIFQHNADSFFDLSVAAHTVTSAMNLLVCVGNQTRDEVWHNLITLGGVAKPGDDAAAAPKQADEENFEGVQVYPNPFNPNTSFRFKVNSAGPVKLQIFNLNGQLVKTLVDGELPPGVHQKRWNGRSQNGYAVASGVYWYRLQIGQKIWNGRIQMIK